MTEEDKNDVVITALKEVLNYASHVDDWIIIKKEILKIIPPNERKLFSTRDPVTKKQRINQFEENLIVTWNEMRKNNYLIMMNNVVQNRNRLLRKYIKQVLLEDAAYGSDLASGGATENPYGAHFVSNDDIYKAVIGPLLDPFKVFIGKAKEIKERVQTFLTVVYETIMTTLNPLLSDDYEKLFSVEKQRIDEIKNKYKDAYDSTWGAFKSTDVAALGFFCYPGLIFAEKVASKTAVPLLSKLSGGELNPFLKDLSSGKVTPDSAELNPFLKGRKPFSEYKSKTNESVIIERKSKSKRTIEDVIFSKAVIKAAVNSEYAKNMKKEAREIYKGKDGTLAKIEQRADAISAAKSYDDLLKFLQNLDVDVTEAKKKIEEAKKKMEEAKKQQKDKTEIEKIEKKIFADAKTSMKRFYSKNLKKHISDAVNAGIPENTEFVKDYYNLIRKIESKL